MCVSGTDVAVVLQESKKAGRRVITETVVRRIIIHCIAVLFNSSRFDGITDSSCSTERFYGKCPDSLPSTVE